LRHGRVTKAAQDASALFDSIIEEANLDLALVRYQSERTPFGTRIVQHAQALGAYMQAQIASAEERRDAEIYRTVEADRKANMKLNDSIVIPANT
jgi:hypothetical protein